MKSLLLFVLLLRRAVSNILPYPAQYFVKVTPKKKQGPIHVRGNTEFHWEEDLEGYTVVFLNSRGYYYARRNNVTCDLEVTDLPIRKYDKKKGTLKGKSPATIGIEPHQLPCSDLVMSGCGNFCMQPQDELVINPVGIIKNLVILMRFSDHELRTVPSQSDINILMNDVSDGVTSQFNSLAPTGSVREYYRNISYNKTIIDSFVSSWVTINYTESYCAGGNSGLTSLIHTCLTDALTKVDAQINFAQFDTNGDKIVDAITFLHSGYGAEWGGTDSFLTYYTNRIWSHKWSLSSTFNSSEGIKVSQYNIGPSVWSTSGSSIGRIGVIAHELGHVLGLPDLYDTDGGGEGVGSWSLMANSWGFDFSQYYPPPLDPWSKIRLGWITPTVIDPSDSVYQIGPQCMDSTVYKITRNFPASEYLLIENRDKSCLYDSQMGGVFSGGLAIWHIDDNLQNYNTEGYPGQSGWPSNGKHYKIAILQSDELYQLEKGLNRGDFGDLFRAGNVLRPSIASPYPNTDTYSSGNVTNTHNCFTSIFLNAGNISFLFTDCSRIIFPTLKPTKAPTKKPTKKPTRKPSKKPTRKPSKKPTRIPSRKPTRKPTKKPTRKPTKKPTRKPTKKPTRKPTKKPTRKPTKKPTKKPSKKPNQIVSGKPTSTKKPSGSPTIRKVPTRTPTVTNSTVKKPNKKPKKTLLLAAQSSMPKVLRKNHPQ